VTNFIAHFDVDAFYASVAVRDDPSLRGKPVAVAGSSRRAVVLTASYEARTYGVRSATPLYRAREACPGLVVVRPDMQKYKAVSREIFAIFGKGGHNVEGSWDEAYIDFGDCALDDARELARAIRAEVAGSVGLTVSAGVAGGKLVAKIASDACKPDGLSVIAPGGEAAFLAPLPVGRLPGIGPKTQPRLERRGVTTIGDVANLSDAALKELFGSWGAEVRDLARGIDSRRVHTDRETKSISTEETFEYDIADEPRLLAVLREHSLELARDLEKENLVAQTVAIKIKRADFVVFSRQTHLSEPTRDAERIYAAAAHCLERAALAGTPIRLLGTRVAHFAIGESAQQNLF
jgi:DNA polymerase IV